MQEKFMKEALKEAKKAYKKLEIPVGAVIVKDGKIRDIEDIKDSLSLGNGLFMNGDFNQMIQYIKSGNPIMERARFYLGYAGWEENQLQSEIEENSWIVSELSKERFFKESYKDLWTNTLNDMGEPYRTWAQYPSIPSLN